MTRVRIVCDSNFRKTEDVDESVAKVLKMFSQHFVKKMAPLNEESDMECVYIYDNLTPEKVRLLKRLLNHNKTLLNFKEIILSKPGNDGGSDPESLNRLFHKGSSLDSQKVSSLDSHGSCHSSIDSSLNSSNSSNSLNSSNSSNSTNSLNSSNSAPSFTSDALGEDPSDENDRFLELANKLRALADEVENLRKT